MKNTIDKEMLREQFAKTWSDPGMIKYCTEKVAAVAILPRGEIITVDKQRIEKRFCFGESGYDFDEAVSKAAHARKSENYFKTENMKHFREWIASLTDALDTNSSYRLTIGSKEYTGQPDDCKLGYIRFEKLSDVIEACGGSCYLSELPGKELTINRRSCRVATPEEIKLILIAYEAAAAAHEKKVDSYLKRYGMTKVETWTYWRDA
jgi:hypothetical protein